MSLFKEKRHGKYRTHRLEDIEREYMEIVDKKQNNKLPFITRLFNILKSHKWLSIYNHIPSCNTKCEGRCRGTLPDFGKII